jgi:hypothetical protein
MILPSLVSDLVIAVLGTDVYTSNGGKVGHGSRLVLAGVRHAMWINLDFVF